MHILDTYARRNALKSLYDMVYQCLELCELGMYFEYRDNEILIFIPTTPSATESISTPSSTTLSIQTVHVYVHDGGETGEIENCKYKTPRYACSLGEIFGGDYFDSEKEVKNEILRIARKKY